VNRREQRDLAFSKRVHDAELVDGRPISEIFGIERFHAALKTRGNNQGIPKVQFQPFLKSPGTGPNFGTGQEHDIGHRLHVGECIPRIAQRETERFELPSRGDEFTSHLPQ